MRTFNTLFMVAAMCVGLITAGASAQDDLDFDDLLGGGDKPAVEKPADPAPAPTGEEIALDDLLGGGDKPADTVVKDPETQPEADPVEPPVESVEPAPLPEDPAEAAEVLANRETVARRARELTGLKMLEEGYNALRSDDFTGAIEKFEKAQTNIPERPETDDDRMKAAWGLSEANFRLAERAYTNENFAEAEARTDIALQYDPTSKQALALAKKIERRKGRPGKAPIAREDENLVKKQDQIDFWMDQGKQYYELGEFHTAEGFFERVLLRNEFHRDAIRFLKRINDRKFDVRTDEMWATKSRMMENVRNTWNPPIRLPEELQGPAVIGPGTTVDTQNDAQVLERKMDQIIIPRIEFRQANITDVVSFLVDASIASDPDGVGVNIILSLGSGDEEQPGTGGGTGMGDPFTEDPFAADPFARDPFAEGGTGVTPDDGRGQPATSLGGSGSGGEIPSITLNLRRVSLLDAIRFVSEVAGLKYRIEKKVVIITRADQVTGQIVTKIYPVQPSIMDMIIEKETTDRAGGGGDEFVEMGGTVTMTRGDVRQFFIDAGVPFPRGTSITFNAAISSLIVANTAENMAIFERILSVINVIPKQIEIESRFVEVIQSDLQELGLEWIITDDIELFEKTGPGGVASKERVQIDASPQGVTAANRFFGQGESGLSPAFRNGVGVPGFVGSMFSVSSVLTNPELQVVLHAIDQSGNTDTLSAPRVTTRNGVNAQIEVVDEIIYPSEFTSEAVSGGAALIPIIPEEGIATSQNIVIYPSAFETREVGVILNVTPTVGPDGYTIELTLAPEVAELTDWVQYGTPPYNIPQPIFSSRNVTTSINIWDGQTVVMGGLIKEEMVTINDKIPLLGDIPLLGRLFSTKGEASRKHNLLIFVTARVVDPAGNPIRKTTALEVAEGSGLTEGSGLE